MCILSKCEMTEVWANVNSLVPAISLFPVKNKPKFNLRRMAGMKQEENRANSTTHPAYERYRWRHTWLVKPDHMTFLFCFHDGGLWCHVSVDLKMCWLTEDHGQTSFHSFLNCLIISTATRDTQNNITAKKTKQNRNRFWPHLLLRFDTYDTKTNKGITPQLLCSTEYKERSIGNLEHLEEQAP